MKSPPALPIAGVIVLAGGPGAAGIAGLVSAGLGGAAVKEILDRYTAGQHSEEFAAALHAGAVLLWARCTDPERELSATRILEAAGRTFAPSYPSPSGKASGAQHVKTPKTPSPHARCRPSGPFASRTRTDTSPRTT